MRSEGIDYVRLMEATWGFLNASAVGRRRVLERLPQPEQRALAAAEWPGLEAELARRRNAAGKVLLESYPVTYFAYAAREGAEGILCLLESSAWSSRPTYSGSTYPQAAAAAHAFQRFVVSSGWVLAQQDWIQQAFAFETACLFGAPQPPPRNVEGAVVRLAGGAWVADAPFDVFATGKQLRERAQEVPWYDALYQAKPRPCPCALVSVRAQDKIRRVRLTGDTAIALRWIWDAGAEIPAGALDTPALRRALDAGLVDVDMQ